jgi:hypothetical protein
MNYRTVYDVLREKNWGDPRVFLTLLAMNGVGFLVFLLVGTVNGDKHALTFAYVSSVMVATFSLPIFGISFVNRARAKRWVRTRQYQIIEGRISAWSSYTTTDTFLHVLNPRFVPQRVDSFEVNGVRLQYRGSWWTGGFRGYFNAASDPWMKLQEGQQVRITHRGGWKLRIELEDQV